MYISYSDITMREIITEIDLAFYCVAKYDVKEYDVPQYGVIEYSVREHDVAEYGVAEYGAVEYGLAECGVTEYDESFSASCGVYQMGESGKQSEGKGCFLFGSVIRWPTGHHQVAYFPQLLPQQHGNPPEK